VFSVSDPVTVAAYYFPNFHVDPRNEVWHGPGWTEWELTKRAEPRFPGHLQPRSPVWGYEDESDPAAMSRKIDAAVAHGMNAFIFDWYWYSGRPYLQRPLEEAFMARTDHGLDFAVMWANHDWVNIHPWKRGTDHTMLETGAADPGQFRAATDYIIERYFPHPQYLRLAGRPYLSLYDLNTLLTGLGGIEPAAVALNDLRSRAANAGFPDIHLNAIGWDQPVLPGETTPDLDTIVGALGFDSVTSYVWVHHHRLPTLQTPYAAVLEEAERGWYEFAERFPVPYFPNVTVGWDPSPRTVQSDGYDPTLGYPHTNVITDNGPEIFGAALDRAQRFLSRTGARLLTINAWNEWTEGSYLEPDTTHGLGHLAQIRRVFGRE
jgi:hypothetical protein